MMDHRRLDQEFADTMHRRNHIDKLVIVEMKDNSASPVSLQVTLPRSEVFIVFVTPTIKKLGGSFYVFTVNQAKPGSSRTWTVDPPVTMDLCWLTDETPALRYLKPPGGETTTKFKVRILAYPGYDKISFDT